MFKIACAILAFGLLWSPFFMRQTRPGQLPKAVGVRTSPPLPWHVGRVGQTKWKLETGVEGFEPALKRISTKIGANDFEEAARLMESWAPKVKNVAEADVDYDEGVRAAWEAAAGDLYLLAGRWEAAERAFKHVLSNPKEGFKGSYSRQYAAYGMARISTVKGDYPRAEEWLAQGAHEVWSGCGNCEESERNRNYVVKTAWDRASQKYEQARRELIDMIDGKFPTQPAHYNLSSEQWEHEMGRAEAATALGQILLKQGRTAEARQVLLVALEPNKSGDSAAQTAYGMLNALDHPPKP